MPFESFFRRLYPRLGPIHAAHPFLLALSTLKVIALAHLSWHYVLDVQPASGPSMLPTMSVVGDWIAISRHYRRGRDVRVGDLVAFRIPVFQNSRGIKRVMGMPGDYVLMGTPGTPGTTENMIQIPQGHCWLVGDNLSASRDSRTYGPVPLALVEGKVIGRVLPWSERKWIGNGLDEAEEAAVR